MPPHALRLQLGAWRLDVRPQLGGSVLGLWHGDLAVLRPTPEGATHAGQTAGFALVPYSNRIGYKAFEWGGERHTIAGGFDDGPHALHGVGFMRPWQVVAQGADRLRLRLEHAGDADWPFAFVAEQQFALDGHGLNLRLNLLNTDAREQPAGLGWHPYFVRRAGALLHGDDVHTQWRCGADLLPSEPMPLAGLNGPVVGRPLDHCFSGGNRLGFSDPLMSVELRASSAHWVVFTPSGFDFFCLEPVTHVNNAVQMADPLAHGLVALASGESLTQTIDLRVSLR